ncbi:hypothetical protein K439DRAFT_1625363 [Ramaria rubella]|nr:hypothetical protein K439DRAFT_1625363 [Ramaria rubella]
MPPGISGTFGHDGDTYKDVDVDLPPNSPHLFCHGGISDSPPILPSQQSCNEIPQLTDLLNRPRTSGASEKHKASTTPEVLASQASESARSKKHWRLEDHLRAMNTDSAPPPPPPHSSRLPPSSSAPMSPMPPMPSLPPTPPLPPCPRPLDSPALILVSPALVLVAGALILIPRVLILVSPALIPVSHFLCLLSHTVCIWHTLFLVWHSQRFISRSFVDLDAGSYDAKSSNKPENDSDAAVLHSGFPSMSMPPRTPHWIGQSLQIKSATPTYTQPLLNKANHFYEMFLLITHPCLKITSQHRHFSKDAWEGAHEFLESEENITIKFTADIETALHHLGATFCTSLGSQLLSRIPSDYGFGNTEKLARDNIVKQLLTSGNLGYKRVFFDDAGFARLTSDKTTILCTGPFQHPLLETIIIALAFKGRLPLAATNPRHFDPIPLPMIAFTCTLVNHTLDHHLSNDPSAHRDLLGPDYCPVFQSYLDGLELFKRENPRSCAAVQKELWEKGRKVAKIPLQGPQVVVHFTTGLSAEDIEAELAAQGAC